ncbi:hypothetical protein N9R44_01705 [Flavobacteriaceae bacterium]|nr:hypothetical protein [Flavobacteriaceae bacterium]
MKNTLVSIFAVLLLVSSCKKEESVVEPPRDIQEQALDDDQTLEDFLSTHFYNYDGFLDSEFNNELVFDTISGDNAAKTPLINQVKKEIVRIKISEDTYVDHSLYYLIAREGTGKAPAVVDSTYLSYEGSLLDGFSFDSSAAPVWFDLTQVVRGFKEGASKLKSGSYSVNDDNTVDFFGYGQGAIFFPSGLGYFNQTAGSIPAYSPLVFKINLYLVKQTDHDGDGVLSADEYDLNQDGIPDDTDEDGVPDYLDVD